MVGRVSALALAVALATGCSVAVLPFDEGTTFRPPTEPKCTGGGKVAPAIVDSLLAVLLVPLLFAGPSDNERLNDSLGAVGVVFAGSAALGYMRTVRCARAHNRYATWRETHPE